ncbi:MAG: thiamine phosphate synthase [Rhodospirillales bacterium]
MTAMIPESAGPDSTGPALPKRWFFTDDARTRRPDKIIRGLEAGTGVIFRHYAAPDRARLAAACADACRDAGALLLIAGDPRLASQVRAQGVHWPEAMVKMEPEAMVKTGPEAMVKTGPEAALENPSRMPVPPWLLQTAAVHSQAALATAEAEGMDAVFASPVFATVSHPDRQPLGLESLARLCAGARIPVFALGGMTAENTQSALDAGAAGAAGIGLFL